MTKYDHHLMRYTFTVQKLKTQPNQNKTKQKLSFRVLSAQWLAEATKGKTRQQPQKRKADLCLAANWTQIRNANTTPD